MGNANQGGSCTTCPAPIIGCIPTFAGKLFCHIIQSE